MILNSHSVGEGHDLVILHGLFGSWENWGRLMRSLQESYRITGLDLRNHGQSDHVPDMTYAEMAQDVAETLQSLNIEHYTLLGHSMGGKVAMTLAAQSVVPANKNTDANSLITPAKLIIVDIAPREYPPTHLQMMQAMLDLNVTALTSRTDADAQLANVVAEPSVRQFLLKSLRRLNDVGYQWQINLPALYESYTNLLGVPSLIKSAANRYPNPVLVIRGSASDYVSDSDLQKYRQLYSNLSVISIDGAGHWPHASHLAEVQDAVHLFMQD